MHEADAAGATRLYLGANRKLETAIRLYESLGFRHLRPEEITPSRTRAPVTYGKARGRGDFPVRRVINLLML